MLFSLTPKNRKRDLFDREEELKELGRAIETYPIIVVTGLRRVGKSSIIRVFLNESGFPFITVDGRRVYEKSGGNISSSALLNVLRDEFSKLSKSQKLLNFLRRIKGVSLAGNSVEIDKSDFDLTSTFESFNRFAEKESTYFVVFFDEAQYLKFYGSRGGRDILALLSYTYDNLERVRVIVTGSEVGMLHDFLKFEDYDSPLYGRPVYTLSVRPFNFEKSAEFIRKGIEEAGKSVDFDPEEVIREIDGIPGYLVIFGLKYLETGDERKAIEEVYRTMEALFEKELSELEKRSRRYTIVLRLISKGVNTWSSLKKRLSSKNSSISDSSLYILLKNLEKMSIVEKTKEGYKISDPVMEKILRRKAR